MDLIQQLKTPDFIIGFAESRIGGRAENQDSYGSSDTPYGYVITVCDGMGGGPGGKTASTIAVNEIISGIKDGNPDDTVSNIVIKAVRRANLAILSKGQENHALQGMGSTCTVLLINENSAVVAHVGDSRVYQLRGRRKMFRTFDHSMVFDLVRQKVITEEQARLSAQSNVITRALGIKPDVEVDVVELPYLTGDRFILSTDGIHGTISETELIKMASDTKHALGAVTDDITTIIDGNGRKDGGGHDNLTIAIIETNINSKLKSKMDAKSKLLFGALSLICVVSLIFNCISLGRGSAPDDAVQTHTQIADSLNKAYGDSINVLNKKLQAALDGSESNNKELLSKLNSFESRNKVLNDLIEKERIENKELRREIDELKEKMKEAQK